MILNFVQAAFAAVSLLSVHQIAPKVPDDAPVKVAQPLPKKAPLVFESGDSCFTFGWYYRPEFFYGKNLYMLCDCNPTDRVVQPGKHTFDTTIAYQYGNASHGFPIFEFKSVLRSRFTWGVAESPATTGGTPIKFLDTVIADHAHSISLGLPIIRELWMDMSLNELFHFDSSTKHRLRLGFFPFSLGRGISLGEAYATTPDLLGYQISNAIQQFAPGFKISGEIVPCSKLLYDLYVEIVEYVETKILSHPFLVTLNNVHAEETLTTIRRARGDQSVGEGAVSTIRQKDFEAKLKVSVTPRVSSLERVNMEILVDIEDFTSPDISDFTRVTRRVQTNANLSTGQILVLGGLSILREQEGTSGTPILQDIPFFGWLFKNNNRIITRTNLGIFVSPTIVEPKLRAGQRVYTQDKISRGRDNVDESKIFRDYRDPITRWFFIQDGQQGEIFIDEYLADAKDGKEMVDEVGDGYKLVKREPRTADDGLEVSQESAL